MFYFDKKLKKITITHVLYIWLLWLRWHHNNPLISVLKPKKKSVFHHRFFYKLLINFDKTNICYHSSSFVLKIKVDKQKLQLWQLLFPWQPIVAVFHFLKRSQNYVFQILFSSKSRVLWITCLFAFVHWTFVYNI